MLKKIVATAVALIMIMCGTAIGFADVVDNNISAKSQVVTIGDMEKELVSYFEENDYDITLGSKEYIEYLFNLLTFEDEELRSQNSNYENIKIYASEYLSQSGKDETTVTMKNSDNEKVWLLTKDAKSKTIEDVKAEAIAEDIFVESIVTHSNATHASSYNGYYATTYAKKWAKSRNPRYNDHDGAGGDCTNFVSQCVVAGGKSMTKPSPVPAGITGTVNHWYSVRYTSNGAYKWKESSSFVNVLDFYTYWKYKGVTTALYSSKAALKDGAGVGNVVQLKNGSGKWYHSIIITGGIGDRMTYCCHTGDVEGGLIDNLSGAVKYRALKF